MKQHDPILAILMAKQKQKRAVGDEPPEPDDRNESPSPKTTREVLVDLLIAAHEIRLIDRGEVLAAVNARERSISTGLTRYQIRRSPHVLRAPIRVEQARNLRPA